MIVIDASALVEALVDTGPMGERVWLMLAEDRHWASVPHLTAEVFSGICGQHLGGTVSERHARASLADLAALRIDLVDVSLLLDRMWELRHDLSGYDAAYVAAAEALDCPLVTADARLAAAPGIRCEVRLAA